MKSGWRLMWAGAWLLLAAGAAMAAEGGEHGAAAGHHHSPGLAALMQQNRAVFAPLVEKAYFTSVLRQLKQEDFGEIRGQAEQIAGYARQARASFSMGKEFDHLAQELEEHAGKVAAAAGDGRLPKVNVEIGEMAEYCAKCHDTFRWGRE